MVASPGFLCITSKLKDLPLVRKPIVVNDSGPIINIGYTLYLVPSLSIVGELATAAPAPSNLSISGTSTIRNSYTLPISPLTGCAPAAYCSTGTNAGLLCISVIAIKVGRISGPTYRVQPPATVRVSTLVEPVNIE